MSDENTTNGQLMTEDARMRKLYPDFFERNLRTSKLTKFMKFVPAKTEKGPKRTFAIININQYFDENLRGYTLEEFDPNDGWGVVIVLLVWDTGFGKTTQVIRYYKSFAGGLYNWTILAIVHRKKLSADLANKFGITCYLDVEGVIRSSVAITINSLLRVGFQPHILFIDEIEGVLEILTSDDEFLSYSLQQSLYIKLLELVQTTSSVIIADANMGELTGLLLKQAGSTKKAIISTTERNQYDWHYVGTHKIHHQIILEKLQQGYNVGVACMSKNQGERLVQSLLRMGVDHSDILFLHASTPGIDDFINDPSQEKYRVRCLIYTPVIDAGVSIDLKDWFHSIHLFCSRLGCGNNALQMIARIRNLITNQILFSGSLNNNWMVRKLNYSIVQKNVQLRSEFYTEFLETNVKGYKQRPATDPRYKEFIQHYEFNSVNRGKGWVTSWLIDNYPVNDMSEYFKSLYGSGRNQSYDKSGEEVDARWQSWVAKGCSVELYEHILDKKGTLSEKEKACLEHYRLKHFYNIDDFSSEESKRLILDDRYRIITKKVQLYSRVMVRQSTQNVRAVLLEDLDQEINKNYLHRDFYTGRTYILCTLLDQLDIDLSQPISTKKYHHQSLAKEQEWAVNNEPLLKLFEIPIPSKNIRDSIKWLQSILSLLNLKTIPHKQRRLNGRRIREYSLDLDQQKKMIRLSEAERCRVLDGEYHGK